MHNHPGVALTVGWSNRIFYVVLLQNSISGHYVILGGLVWGKIFLQGS